jgi:hypothetical protein
MKSTLQVLSVNGPLLLSYLIAPLQEATERIFELKKPAGRTIVNDLLDVYVYTRYEEVVLDALILSGTENTHVIAFNATIRWVGEGEAHRTDIAYNFIYNELIKSEDIDESTEGKGN